MYLFIFIIPKTNNEIDMIGEPSGIKGPWL